MADVKTPNEKLLEEQKHKEHIHHTRIDAPAILDHVLGNLHTLHVKLHQYHWYVKGSHFYTLHAQFENLYQENEDWFDKIAEELISLGNKPASTTQELIDYSMLAENPADKYISSERMVENIAEDFKTTRDLVLRAIKLAADDQLFALEDTLIDYQAYLDKNIWMLLSFLGKDVLEDDFED